MHSRDHAAELAAALVVEQHELEEGLVRLRALRTLRIQKGIRLDLLDLLVQSFGARAAKFAEMVLRT
eukprot:scaffold442_cov268-Pinguiococcus_pyrenoidosus.AAC.77